MSVNVNESIQEVNNDKITKTKTNLEAHGIKVIVVENRQEAFNTLKEMLPAGAEVMTGSSTTLTEIGFMDYYLSNQHPWKNIGSPIYLEQDPKKKAEMRRKSVIAQYFTASINAITEDGQLVAVDGSGSRVGAYPFGAEKVVLVSGINKIVPTLNDAFDRIRNVVVPLESDRAMKRYGRPARANKWVIIEREIIKERMTLILVKENLGF